MTDQLNTPTFVAGDDALLPDGYVEGDDFFNVDSWSGKAAQTDGSDATADATDEATTEATAETEESPAIETDTGDAEGSKTEEDKSPATKTEEPQPNKLRFKAKVDHQDVDVELDDSELPSLYEKSRVVDRVRAKLDKQTSIIEKSKKVTKLLGYKDIDEMLDAAKQSYIETQEEQYKHENVHPDVAKDMVKRHVAEIEASIEADKDDAEIPKQPTDKATVAPNGRDFRPEVAELLSVYKDLKGQTLPDEVVKTCISTGEPLLKVYTEYITRLDKAEMDKLRQENNTLKQNAEAAKRAPVTGVTGKSDTDKSPIDPFLQGFDEESDRHSGKFMRR